MHRPAPIRAATQCSFDLSRPNRSYECCAKLVRGFMKFLTNRLIRCGLAFLSLYCFVLPTSASSLQFANGSSSPSAIQQEPKYSFSVEVPLVVVDVLVTD